MFFIPSVLMKRNEPLAVIWRVVFDEKWRPSRKVILDINVQNACELLIDKIPNGNPGEIKFSLYLLAQLTYGIAVIVQKRGDILCRDLETFIPFIRRYRYEEEKESVMKGRKDKKKRAAKQNDLFILDSSFQTIENEHLNVVLDYSAFTLREDIPLPEVDIMFNDDFGPLTEAEAQQMEALLKEDSEHVFESKSGSTNGSKECVTNIVPEALISNADTEKASNVCEILEVSEEAEMRKERQYDLGSDEALQVSEMKRPTHLSALELSEIHDSQMEIPKKKRRKHGTIIDEITMFNKTQLQDQIDSYYELLHTWDEMIPHISKRGVVTVQDLFEIRPMTLREFAKNPGSNLDSWIAAPEYDEPPLQYKDAMQLEPMQAPPMRILRHSPNSMPHESSKTNLHDPNQQTLTPVTEDIERGRRNTTSTAPFGSIHTTDPSSQLRSETGFPIAFGENLQYDDKLKISVATIFEKTAEGDILRERMDDSSILSAEKARFTDLFSNLAIESELRGTRLESSAENILVDEKYSEHEMRKDGPQNEINVQKISVMQDRFQLKGSNAKNTVETGYNSAPVYYKTQRADDLFEWIVEFSKLHKVSTLYFSQLIRGHSAAFVAKAFTNLLVLLAKQKVKVKQEKNFDEIIIHFS